MYRIAFGFLMAGMAALVAFVPFPAPASSSTVRTLRVEAGQFAFAPALLRVEPGDRVILELVATDVVHGLYLDGYDLSLSADPGQTARLAFTADRPGVFRFRCSITCGALHPFMLGKLQVGRNDLLWRGAGLIVVILFALFFHQPRLSLNAAH